MEKFDGFEPPFIYKLVERIDEDGTIKTIHDEAWCFQFVRRNGGAADGKTNNNA